jgi:hypothetical protein
LLQRSHALLDAVLLLVELLRATLRIVTRIPRELFSLICDLALLFFQVLGLLLELLQLIVHVSAAALIQQPLRALYLLQSLLSGLLLSLRISVLGLLLHILRSLLESFRRIGHLPIVVLA